MWGLALLLIVGGIGVACDSGGASDGDDDDDDEDTIAQTFSVTVQGADSDYPYSEQNQNGVAYAIDGEVGKVITLERGETYEFELGDGVDGDDAVSSHPFYVDETAEGQQASPYSEGVENAGATTGSVLFTVPSSAPDSLYYECGNHAYMGGKMLIGASNSGDDDDGDDGGDDDGGGNPY